MTPAAGAIARFRPPLPPRLERSAGGLQTETTALQTRTSKDFSELCAVCQAWKPREKPVLYFAVLDVLAHFRQARTL